MSDAVLRRMTADEFLDWSLDQEDKYELVDGEPVLMGDWIEVDGRTTSWPAPRPSTTRSWST
jgi:hypothetical protein